MNLKKKINISLTSILGVSAILALVFLGAFVFLGFLVSQKNLVIPKVQANPGHTCEVADHLLVKGSIFLSHPESQRADCGNCLPAIAGEIVICKDNGDCSGWGIQFCEAFPFTDTAPGTGSWECIADL